MSRIAGNAALLILVASIPANAQTRWQVGSNAASVRNPAVIQQTYVYRLNLLRAEILKQTAADGGRLSTENAARYQSTLDQLNDTRVRQLRNADIWSVDASGKPAGR